MKPGADNGEVILAGDIGGTKTHLGLFLRGRNRPLLKSMETYRSREAAGLEAIIDRFLEGRPGPVSAACFGIAGPVINGRCRATNLPWRVSEEGIRRRFRWPGVRLMNDLTATALAVPVLNPKETVSLNRARPAKGGNIAIIAPGTGLGQAILVSLGKGYVPVSSEGGHVDFAPASENQEALRRFLGKLYGHVSVERILSGPGLMNIYDHLKASGGFPEPAWLSRLLKETDPAGAVSESALKGRSRLCSESLDMFVSILGAVAGNLVLTAAATGGLFLGGGIPPKILPRLKGGLFMEAFTSKGRFSDFMKKVPVRVILNQRAALLGAARGAFDILDGGPGGRVGTSAPGGTKAALGEPSTP